MSRVPWRVFNDHQSRAHLVAAVLCTVPTGADPDPREAQVLLERLVRIQKPASYYATTVVRDAGRPEVARIRGQGRCPKVGRCGGGRSDEQLPRLGDRTDLRFEQRDGGSASRFASTAEDAHKTTASRTTSISPRRTRGKNSHDALRLIGKQSSFPIALVSVAVPRTSPQVKTLLGACL
jgi:hypothetical protein